MYIYMHTYTYTCVHTYMCICVDLTVNIMGLTCRSLQIRLLVVRPARLHNPNNMNCN